MLIYSNTRLPHFISLYGEIVAFIQLKKNFLKLSYMDVIIINQVILRKKLGGIEVILNYNNDDNFCVMVKMIISLAFISD